MIRTGFLVFSFLIAFTSCQNPTSAGTGNLTISYFGNGATGGTVPVDSNKYAAGGSATVLDNTGNLVLGTSVGFVGWNTSASGDGTTYTPGAVTTLASSSLKLFAVWGVPTIASVSPNNGSPGSVMTVSGTGFSRILTNDFIGIVGYTGHTAGTGTGYPGSATSTTMTYTIPTTATPGTYDVDGNIDYDGSTPTTFQGSTRPTYTVNSPSIASVTPSSGFPGTVITVTGSGFSTTLSSDWIGILGYSGHTQGTGTGNPTTATSTTLTYTIPLSVLTGTYTVGGSVVYSPPSTNQVNDTGAPTFTVSAPTITSVSPSSGHAGSTYTVTGTGFSTTLGNDFVGAVGGWGGTSNPTAATSTTMTLTVPSGASPGTYSIAGNVDYDGSTPTNFGGTAPTFTVN